MYSIHESLVGFNCRRNRLPFGRWLLTLFTHCYGIDCLRCSPIFLLGPMLLGCQQVLSCHKVTKIYSPAFFYEFCTSPFTPRSSIHPESTLVHGVCCRSGFIFFFFPVRELVSPTPVTKQVTLSLLICGTTYVIYQVPVLTPESASASSSLSHRPSHLSLRCPVWTEHGSMCL